LAVSTVIPPPLIGPPKGRTESMLEDLVNQRRGARVLTNFSLDIELGTKPTDISKEGGEGKRRGSVSVNVLRM